MRNQRRERGIDEERSGIDGEAAESTKRLRNQRREAGINKERA
ncbi:hypothetical protein NSQ54_02070 [Alkalihalobacillus sp. FSL W8-0930]